MNRSVFRTVQIASVPRAVVKGLVAIVSCFK